MNSFLNSIQNLVTVRAKPKVNYTPTPAQNFREAGLAEIKAIKGGAAAGKWFKKSTEGEYVLTLRNGKRVVEIAPGMIQAIAATESRAIEFIEKALAACADGFFDPIFAAQKTTRKTR